VVTNGNKSAYSQHYSTAQGSVGSVQGSGGGKAIGSSTAYGGNYAAKSSNGDMYAGHDGNVYKNTGSGWQTYNNGSWNDVQKPTQATAQQSAQSYQQQHPNSSANEAQAQQRAQSYQQQHPSTSSYQRPEGSSSYQRPEGNSEMSGLQQDAQNRQRGAEQSDRFQRSGGGGWGGGRGGWGGGGRRR